ncbi:hypothetical protein HZB00_03195 [Candidatus Woesearchaeota archaeon]|nr:hypothetical protein [Candidatus Woesearchaeota archaeon]
MAKGVMYTLIFLWLSLLLLSVGALTSSLARSTETRGTELALFQRITTMDASLQKTIRTLVLRDAHATYLSQNSSITIIEDFPLNISILNQSLSDLKTFVEHDEPHALLNLSQISLFPFILMPPKTSYTHSPAGVVIQNYSLITGMTFDFFFGNLAAGTITWNSFSAGSNPVRIISGNTSITVASNNSIDLSKEFQITIQSTSSGEGPGRIVLTNDDGIIQASNQLNATIQSNITFFFSIPFEQQAVFLPDFLAFQFPEFNVTKQGNVRLTT